MTKITLATLHQATAQEVADQIVNHLLDQGERCFTNKIDEGYSCKYRNNNLMCAAGCLMADDEYKEEFERRSWGRLVEQCGITTKHGGLIEDFQFVHDSEFEGMWEEGIKRVLHTHGLKFNRRVSPVVAVPPAEVL